MGKSLENAAAAIGNISVYNGNNTAGKNAEIFGPNQKEIPIEGLAIESAKRVNYSQGYQQPKVIQAFPSVLPFPGASPGDDPDHKNIIIDVSFSDPIDPSYYLSGRAGGFAKKDKNVVVSGGFASG